MDIVSRLKHFIDSRGIPVTAFADSCGISRPSLSQLLNGRNKKVSHEMIQRIHDAYPELNVLWLMFGQGNMLANDFIETSEPQNGIYKPYIRAQEPVTLTDMGNEPKEYNLQPRSSEKSAGTIVDFAAGENTLFDNSYTDNSDRPVSVASEHEDFAPYGKHVITSETIPMESAPARPYETPRRRTTSTRGENHNDPTPRPVSFTPAPPHTGVTIHPDGRKTIVNIIVYYSDNSFESFVPGNQH